MLLEPGLQIGLASSSTFLHHGLSASQQEQLPWRPCVLWVSLVPMSNTASWESNLSWISLSLSISSIGSCSKHGPSGWCPQMAVRVHVKKGCGPCTRIKCPCTCLCFEGHHGVDERTELWVLVWRQILRSSEMLLLCTSFLSLPLWV